MQNWKQEHYTLVLYMLDPSVNRELESSNIM